MFICIVAPGFLSLWSFGLRWKQCNPQPIRGAVCPGFADVKAYKGDFVLRRLYTEAWSPNLQDLATIRAHLFFLITNVYLQADAN